jgi:chromosome transmission fidelity protein 4
LPEHLADPAGRYSNPEGSVSSLSFSPISNLIAFTTLSGAFTRWTAPIPDSLPSPFATAAAQAKRLEKILDDEFGVGDDEADIEERGEDLFGDNGAIDGEDDWIVDDDGAYTKDEGEQKWRKGRTEVGESICFLPCTSGS